MIPLKQDFPDQAEAISIAADSNKNLKEALQDYEQACEQMTDTAITEEERAQWAEIRAELVVEIHRIFLRLVN